MPSTEAGAVLRTDSAGFSDLKELSEYLARIQRSSDASLKYFHHDESGGFSHRVNPEIGPEKASKASTATCVSYLHATGKLATAEWKDCRWDELRSYLIEDAWESAGLEPDNPFTTPFLLEGVMALGGREPLDAKQRKVVKDKIDLLNKQLTADGGLGIDYPPTSFLTHKAVRVLRDWDELTATAAKKAAAWNWGHLYEESMLIASESPDSDFFELAYAVLTASVTSKLDRMTPRERRLLQHAVSQFFDGQRSDGGWPRSRPLFLYPGIGNAYCYDYELLVQLLSERPLKPLVLPHLERLGKAAYALDARRVPLEAPSAQGWSSEHHGGAIEAESWPTASVFHFCFELDRLVSDAIRRDVFDYVDAVYTEPRYEPGPEPWLGSLLDSSIDLWGETYSFKEQLEEHFIGPLVEERDAVRDGRAFGPETKISAIIYGPPGTSKTKLADLIAKALGWPLLSLDPSHLTRRGLDNVHAQTDEVFGRLQFCDQIVVLLDEFDELVREREGTGELESRFLTTAMLPKIAALHVQRRLVYIVATNHPEQFDAAIRRPGRFDVIAPLMPPTPDAKYEEWPDLVTARETLTKAETMPEDEIDAVIGDLTYAEAKDLAAGVHAEDDPDAVKNLLERAGDKALLRREDLDASESADTAPKENWKQRIQKESSRIRGLGF